MPARTTRYAQNSLVLKNDFVSVVRRPMVPARLSRFVLRAALLSRVRSCVAMRMPSLVELREAPSRSATSRRFTTACWPSPPCEERCRWDAPSVVETNPNVYDDLHPGLGAGAAARYLVVVIPVVIAADGLLDRVVDVLVEV